MAYGRVYNAGLLAELAVAGIGRARTYTVGMLVEIIDQDAPAGRVGIAPVALPPTKLAGQSLAGVQSIEKGST